MNINNLINTLPKSLKTTTKFLQNQEEKASLSNTRFAQDTITNLVPKAIFARSKADLAENSFLEITESLLVYYGPKIFGENVFRKIYSKNLDKSSKMLLSTPLLDLKKDKNLNAEQLKAITPIKAAIALSAMLIPLAEFTVNYVKNMFTLKLFKQGDFNNIANLNKNKKEENKSQEKIKKSAISNIKKAAIIFAGCVAASILLVKKGKNSKALQHLSELILTPGDKLFSKNSRGANFVNKYFSLDFADQNGKLALSQGQLTSCVLIGGLGYFGAAKDRGKQNYLETAFRFPLVGFYIITGSSMFEKGLKTLLRNKKSYQNIISKDLKVPNYSELPQLAQNLAKKNLTSVEQEYKKLCKQKNILSSVPFLFGIGFMGLFVSGVSRFFTQYRFNKDNKEKSNRPSMIKAKTLDDYLASNTSKASEYKAKRLAE